MQRAVLGGRQVVDRAVRAVLVVVAAQRIMLTRSGSPNSFRLLAQGEDMQVVAPDLLRAADQIVLVVLHLYEAA